jgi:PAS domain S-box-containing protein
LTLEERLIALSHDLLCVAGFDGYFKYVNPAWETTLGWTVDELKARPLRSFMHPDDRDRLELKGGGLAIAGAGGPLEIRFLCKDGTHRWLEWTATVGPGEQLVYASGHDISKRKGLAADLGEAQQHYRLLIERLPAIVYVDRVDGVAESSYVSPQVEKLLGLKPEDCVANPEWWTGALHPDDRERAMAEAVFQQTKGTHDTCEYRMYTRDGQLVDIRDDSVLVRDPQGNPEYLLGVMFDVTEHKRVLAELHEAQQRYGQLVERLPAIVYINAIDEATSEIYTSPQVETILGWTTEDRLADPQWWLHSLHPEDREKLQPYLSTRGSHEGPLTHEYRMFARDGRAVWIRDDSLLVHDEAGNPSHVLGVMFDITEVKRITAALLEEEEQLRISNAELEAASRLKSDFVASMSHELRTPLSAIIGFSGVLLDGMDGQLNNEQFDDVSHIQRSAHSLLELINEILDLSKIEAGKMDIVIGPVSVGALMGEVCTTIGTLAQARGISLVPEIPQEEIIVAADRARLRQVLTNLVSNAVKFTTEGGVTVRCEQVDGMVTVSVLDTGIGIAPEAQAFIFEEFRQADVGITRKFGGTGLGLAISKRLIELQGGAIGVESTVGSGSRFWFSIPAAEGQVAPLDGLPRAGTPSISEAPPEVDAAPVWPGQTSRLVLVVDDDEAVRRLITRRLRDANMETVEASSGSEALLIARELHPSAITLDILMPERDGWEVLAALKGDPLTIDIPVVVVSVLEARESALELGAQEALVKPFTTERLVTAVSSAVASIEAAEVLCVDDDPQAVEVVSRALSGAGMLVRSASSAAEALDMTMERRPDALLVDLNMPEVSGFELVSRLRGRDSLAGVPIIVLTSRDLSREDAELLKEGRIDRLLSKAQVRPKDLRATVSQVIKWSRKSHGPDG